MYQDGVIAGCKDSSGDPAMNALMRSMCGQEFLWIHGLDVFPIESFMMGADGWVSGVANVLPDEFAALFGLVSVGRWQEARDEWMRLLPFVRLCIALKEGGASSHQIQLYKTAIRMRGIPVGYTRMPAIPVEKRGDLGQDLINGISRFLASMGIA